jgi:putative oxidoreductase
MKYATLAARALLALIFIVFSLNFWFKFITLPSPTAPEALAFMGAMYTTGYLAAVKVLELLGGLLVASGRFLGAGLLILGPIILNILFIDAFLTKAFNPLSAVAAVLALFLLWTKRDRLLAFCGA